MGMKPIECERGETFQCPECHAVFALGYDNTKIDRIPLVAEYCYHCGGELIEGQ